MRVYVAGKFEEAPRVRQVHTKLREMGFQITHDWTTEDATPYEGAALRAYLAACAQRDLEGVESAEAFLVLNHPKLYGGAVEMGIAISRRIPVLVVGAELRENIFFHLGWRQVDLCSDLDDAYRRLGWLKAKRDRA